MIAMMITMMIADGIEAVMLVAAALVWVFAAVVLLHSGMAQQLAVLRTWWFYRRPWVGARVTSAVTGQVTEAGLLVSSSEGEVVAVSLVRKPYWIMVRVRWAVPRAVPDHPDHFTCQSLVMEQWHRLDHDKREWVVLSKSKEKQPS